MLVPVIEAPSEKIWRYSLVLVAREIPHQVRAKDSVYEIVVPEDYFLKAQAELLAYERENRPKSTSPPQNPSFEGVFWSYLFFTALLALTFDPGWQENLLRLGAGDVTLIKAGQWWRVITALFLHRDPAHLLNNMFFGALFMYFMRANFSLPEAWLYTLLSGILGNTANFYLRPGPHLAIGFSTAVFGEIGLLAASGTLLARERKTFLIRIGFILAFLGLLGAGGKNVDLGAHFFGALAGFLLGKIRNFIRAKF